MIKGASLVKTYFQWLYPFICSKLMAQHWLILMQAANTDPTSESDIPGIGLMVEPVSHHTNSYLV